jgi:hypothetical protein
VLDAKGDVLSMYLPKYHVQFLLENGMAVIIRLRFVLMGVSLGAGAQASLVETNIFSSVFRRQ